VTTYTYDLSTPKHISPGMFVVFYIKDVPYTETYHQPCEVLDIKMGKYDGKTRYRVKIKEAFTGQTSIRYVSPQDKLKVRVDEHGNKLRREGCDRCFCGSKYWERDRCVDCGGKEVES